jgi:septum site-determining protein MinC
MEGLTVDNSHAVIIKGVREGLLIILDDDTPFAQILTELSERITTRPGFFEGSGVAVNTGRRVIDRPEFDVLYKMLSRNGMRMHTFVSLSAQSRMVAESFGVAARPPSFAAGDTGGSLGRVRGVRAPIESPADNVVESGVGLFLRCNLRPGQSVRYAGDVCVLGNVEPGAEIVADGDVVVWGALRGTVHAGALGDDESVVCALYLSPVQLAVAGVVSRFPSPEAWGGSTPARSPELARLEAGRIVVEAWSYQDSDAPGGG